MVSVVVSDQPSSPKMTFYDPANDVNVGGSGGDPETSLTVNRPTLVEVEGVDPTVILEAQVKVSPDGSFKVWETLDGSVDSEFLLEFLQPYNFLRIVRTAGAVDPIAFAQFGNVGHGGD